MPSECADSGITSAADAAQPALLSICAAARALRLSRRQTTAAIGRPLTAVRFQNRPVKVTTASVLAWKRQLAEVPDLDALC
jgi:hypothetical protein